jgi:hypothetical protein
MAVRSDQILIFVRWRKPKRYTDRKGTLIEIRLLIRQTTVPQPLDSCRTSFVRNANSKHGQLLGQQLEESPTSENQPNPQSLRGVWKCQNRRNCQRIDIGVQAFSIQQSVRAKSRKAGQKRGTGGACTILPEKFLLALARSWLS